ncbi:MAG: response regulator [Treponema sp.]|jgi:signal transduction histidine kinase/CheY-like chemotaxis protein|nr:response regulator [Treponema sp.]
MAVRVNNAWYKLTILALGVSITALGIVIGSRAAFTGRVLTSQSLGRIEYEGSLGAARINGWLESQIGYLNGVAEDLGWIMTAYGTEDMQSIIEAHYENYGTDFFQMYLGYPDGSLWSSGEWEAPADYRLAARDWYLGAVRNPLRVFVSEPYVDSRTGSICIALSKAVLRGGELLAVLGADIYLSDIRNMVNDIPIAEGRGFAFLVDGESGIILVHPDSSMMPGEDGTYRTVHDSYGGVYRELLAAAEGESVFIAGYDGARRYCNSQAVPAAGWKFFSLVDHETIQAPISRQIRLQITLSLIVLVLVLALLLAVSRAMRRAAETAKEHSDMKTAFLANMSHEIRTPMNGIIGFAELALEHAGLAAQTRGYLEKIRNSARDLLGILNDILDVSKIEAGKIVLEKIPFDLHDLITACESAISVRAAEKGIGLYIYAEPVIEYRLLGDPTKLRQILLNLLANAVKFTNTGIVKLMVTAEKAAAGRMLLHFEVKDSGIGMTAAQAANVFKSFEQADRSTTRKFGGTGLGLPISKNLVELMGGRLEVESAPGIGSKFSFTLEFELSSQRAGTRGQDSAYPGELRRPVFSDRVLVCEDNTMNQELIRDHLGRLGLEADIVENGRRGLEAVRGAMEEGRPYGLILMDIHMPVMDGLEASTEIKRLGCSSPIVALTANVLTQDTGLYHHYGIAGHLGKPFTSQELWDCLSLYLDPVSYTVLPDGASNSAPPAIDYQTGLAASGGNRELYERLRRIFYDQNKNFFERLLSLVRRGPPRNPPPDGGQTNRPPQDPPPGGGAGGNTGGQNNDTMADAYRMVHGLKSNAALIGAETLRQAAAVVEPLLKGGAHYNREQLEALRKALDAVLGELKGERGDSAAGSPAADRPVSGSPAADRPASGG